MIKPYIYYVESLEVVKMSVQHLIEKKLELLPWYVEEFIHHRALKRSENTLLEYINDYLIFFQWLVDTKYFSGETKDVPLEVLESLRIRDIDLFQSFCVHQRKNSIDTVARRLQSLKSLFTYLSQIAEDENYYPYLKRNVMAKIEIERQKRTQTERAESIQSKILQEDEIEKFRIFVASDYGELIKNNKRAYNYYIQNRERDLALISLILGSGLRVSEAVSLDIDMIDFNNCYVLINRKGGKKDKVVFSDTALQDLIVYRDIRESRYKADKTEKAFFLTLPTNNKRVTRMSKSTAQKMVDKYAEAFGKPFLSIHKLRHTFATQHYKKNKDLITLQRQLGHSNTNTTAIYTHVFDDTLKKSVDKAD